MAKRVFSNPSWTPVAVGNAATMTANGACFIQGGSSSQLVRIHEISISGMAPSTSSPMMFMFGRDSTVAATSITLGTNGMDAFHPASSAALAAPTVVGFSATTMPQRSATLGGLKMPAFNGYGGIYKWQTTDGDVLNLIGNTASLGELSLSVFTGSTPSLVSSEIVYEAD
jgi:hypothetical protein